VKPVAFNTLWETVLPKTLRAIEFPMLVVLGIDIAGIIGLYEAYF
jgi:hypothetical protein